MAVLFCFIFFFHWLLHLRDIPSNVSPKGLLHDRFLCRFMLSLFVLRKRMRKTIGGVISFCQVVEFSNYERRILSAHPPPSPMGGVEGGGGGVISSHSRIVYSLINFYSRVYTDLLGFFHTSLNIYSLLRHNCKKHK